jgi:hypothetical protein
MAPLEVCFKTAVKEEMAQLGASGRCNAATVLSATNEGHISHWIGQPEKKHIDFSDFCLTSRHINKHIVFVLCMII